MFEYDRLALDVAEQFAQIRSNVVASSPTQIFDSFVGLVDFFSSIIMFLYTTSLLKILLYKLFRSSGFISFQNFEYEIRPGRS